MTVASPQQPLRGRFPLLVYGFISRSIPVFIPLCDATRFAPSKHPREKKTLLMSHEFKAGGGTKLPPTATSSPLFLELRQASPALTKALISASLIAGYIFISPLRESHVEGTGLERETSPR